MSLARTYYQKLPQARILPPIPLRQRPWFRLSVGAWAIALVAFSLYQPALPAPEQIEDNIPTHEPIQTLLESPEPIKIELGQYTYSIEPMYDYQIEGLVVTQYDSRYILDFYHQDDPANLKDICLVWGDNAASGVYQYIKFWSGQFTCYYRWRGHLPTRFNPSQMSNNHLIPANDQVKHAIRSVHRGDQIRLKGYLANYQVDKKGQTVFTRETSTTRQDTRGGACEIVYVTEVEIIKKNWPFFGVVKVVAWITSLACLVLLFKFKK